jgi:hypothetical protein
MKIDNHTNRATADIRKIILACCREADWKAPKGIIVRVVYAKTNRISGWAMYGAYNGGYDNRKRIPKKLRHQGCAMLLRIPRGEFNLERFIGVVRHEVGHWRNIRHPDMSEALLYSRFKIADHPWAQGLTLGHQAEPKGPTLADRVSAREQHAREMLSLHERKMEREKKLVARWRAKVRYYDQKAAREPQKMAASRAEPEVAGGFDAC